MNFQTLGSWTNFLHQIHVSVFGMGFQSNPKEGYPHNICATTVHIKNLFTVVRTLGHRVYFLTYFLSQSLIIKKGTQNL